MRGQVLLASLLLASFSMQCHAQQSSSGQQSSYEPSKLAQTMMQASMSAMVSAVGPMAEAVVETELALGAKPETAERVAAFKRNLFEALIKKGFTAKEALQIVIATSPPSVSLCAR